jgi:hypothetical protein
MADPVSITVTGVAISALLAAFSYGFTIEKATRPTALKDVGQNDITEKECEPLCKQIRDRWNELCLAQSDEATNKTRWLLAGAASAAAALIAAGLVAAAKSALAIPIIGLLVAAALAVTAAIATGVAAGAAGAAFSAFAAWLESEKTLQSVRASLAKARAQMEKECGVERATQCVGALPPCV